MLPAVKAPAASASRSKALTPSLSFGRAGSGGGGIAASILSMATPTMAASTTSSTSPPLSPSSLSSHPRETPRQAGLIGQASGGGLGSSGAWPGDDGDDDDAMHARISGTGSTSAVPGILRLATPSVHGDSSPGGELLAAGVIAECQGSGVCALPLKGMTALPTMLLRYLKAEGCLLREMQLQGNRLSACPPLELLTGLTALDLSSNLLTQGECVREGRAGGLVARVAICQHACMPRRVVPLCTVAAPCCRAVVPCTRQIATCLGVPNQRSASAATPWSHSYGL